MAQDDEKKDKEIEIDFDAFEKQIDLEIDKLFIASESAAPISAQAGKTGGGKEDEIEGTIEMEPLVLDDADILFAEEPAASSREGETEIDLPPEEVEFIMPEDEPIAYSQRLEPQAEAENRKEGLEAQIPFEEFGEQTEPQIEFSIPASAEEVFSRPDTASFAPDEIREPEISFPKSEAERQKAAFKEPYPIDRPLEPHFELRVEETPRISQPEESFEQMLSLADEQGETDELDRLIEALDIAYLSLDWDFSSENVAVLENAVSDLKPYWEKIHEAASIQKVIRAVLQHLKNRPNALSPPLIEFISESLEFLKALVLSETGPGPAEKAQLKSLLDRLHAIKGGRTEAAPSSEPSSAAVQSAAALIGPQLRDFCEWMALFRNRSGQAVQSLNEETQRLVQLEQVLGKKPALAPVTARLTKARSSVEQFIASFRSDESEWEKRMESLRLLEQTLKADISSSSPAAAAASPASSQPPASSPPAAQPVAEPALPREPFKETLAKTIETRQDKLFLFQAGGKRFALPASSVVKIEKVPDRKARKLLGRGYATLDDFKPLFKSIKTGLLGDFNYLAPKELKGYRFLPLPLESIKSAQQSSAGAFLPELPPLVGAVILLSNRKRHVMIFTDPSGAELRSETIELRAEDESTLGIIQSGSYSSVRVLNVDLILEKLDQ